jgi:hypothetical protein
VQKIFGGDGGLEVRGSRARQLNTAMLRQKFEKGAKDPFRHGREKLGANPSNGRRHGVSQRRRIRRKI